MQRDLQDDLKRYGLTQLDIPEKSRKSYRKKYSLEPKPPKIESPATKIWKTIRFLIIGWFLLTLLSNVFFLLYDDNTPTVSHTSTSTELLYPASNLEDYGGIVTYLQQVESYQHQGLTITPEALVAYEDGEHQLTLLIENHQSSNITAILYSLTVNGYFIEDAFLFAEVPQGEVVRAQIWMQGSGLAQANITQFYDFSFSLHLMDHLDPNAPSGITQPISVTLDQRPETEPVNRGFSLVEADGLSLSLEEFTYHSDSAVFNLLLFAENTTPDFIQLTADCAMAGFPVIADLYATIPGDSMGYLRLELYLTQEIIESVTYIDHIILTPFFEIQGETFSAGPLSIPAQQPLV